MLPRELRVSRCKAPHKTARAMEARMGKAAASSSDRRGGSDRRRPGNKKADEGRYVPKPTAESQTLAGRAGKLLGRFGAAQLAGKPPRGGKDNQKRRERKERFMSRGAGGGGGDAAAGGEKGGIKGPEQFVFEGRRASARDGKPKDLKFKGGKKTKDPRHKKRKSTFGK